MIYSFLYVLIFSAALILIQKLDLTIPPLLSLLVTASIATLYFNFINLKHLKKMYVDCFSNIKQWFNVMIIVLVMWTTTMIGPSKIGASLFNFTYFAWLGALGYIWLGVHDQQYRRKILFGFILLVLIVLSIFFKFYLVFDKQFIYGIALSVIGGTCSFIYFKQSRQFTKAAALSATQILAVRFYFAIFVLLMLMPKYHVAHYITISHLMSLSLLAFSSLIIPLYCSQKALEKITAEQHAIINSLCPIVTGIFQEVVFKDVKYEQMTIYILYTLIVILFYFFDRYYKLKEFIK